MTEENDILVIYVLVLSLRILMLKNPVTHDHNRDRFTNSCKTIPIESPAIVCCRPTRITVMERWSSWKSTSLENVDKRLNSRDRLEKFLYSVIVMPLWHHIYYYLSFGCSLTSFLWISNIYVGFGYCLITAQSTIRISLLRANTSSIEGLATARASLDSAVSADVPPLVSAGPRRPMLRGALSPWIIERRSWCRENCDNYLVTDRHHVPMLWPVNPSLPRLPQVLVTYR